MIAAMAAAAALAAPAPAPAVGVSLLEWEVALGRRTVRAKAIRLNVDYLGEDTHDLVVRAASGRIVKRLPELRAGMQLRGRARLPKPGRYVLFCSLPEHEERGMRATLRVLRPRATRG